MNDSVRIQVRVSVCPVDLHENGYECYPYLPSIVPLVMVNSPSGRGGVGAGDADGRAARDGGGEEDSGNEGLESPTSGTFWIYRNCE